MTCITKWIWVLYLMDWWQFQLCISEYVNQFVKVHDYVFIPLFILNCRSIFIHLCGVDVVIFYFVFFCVYWLCVDCLMIVVQYSDARLIDWKCGISNTNFYYKLSCMSFEIVAFHFQNCKSCKPLQKSRVDAVLCKA